MFKESLSRNPINISVSNYTMRGINPRIDRFQNFQHKYFDRLSMTGARVTLSLSKSVGWIAEFYSV